MKRGTFLFLSLPFFMSYLLAVPRVFVNFFLQNCSGMTTKTLAIASLIFMSTLLFACRPSDTELKKEVNEKLSLIPGITADVKNGVVILTGEVSDEVAKSAAEDALKDLKGVRAVQDSITVKAPVIAAPAPAVPNPDELLKKSLDSVYAANGFNNITVTISAGEVTLDGTAKRKQLRKIVQLAQQSGTKKVTNNIQIK
ncbi:BON domain-containing protein [Chitinophaga arvensicola]|uniref:BON domain-containing protein n=2 Tax=Chitinophaga arvensicola TaxID=29529 RepID=A0A1I0NXW7_9BACT|nr:BON domain-containing protein [Chitinophaga arvensicola]